MIRAKTKNRLLASLIDIFLATVICYAIVFLLLYFAGQVKPLIQFWKECQIIERDMFSEYWDSHDSLMLTTYLYFLLGIFIGWFLYFVIIPLIYSKQTIGRMFFNVKVVRMSGGKAKFKDLAFRELICILFGFAMLPIISFIYIIMNFIMAFSQQGYVVHDILSNTCMVIDPQYVKEHQDEFTIKEDRR